MITVKVMGKRFGKSKAIKEWLEEVNKRLNSSELLKQKAFDTAVFGSSTITYEEIVEEISSKNVTKSTQSLHTS